MKKRIKCFFVIFFILLNITVVKALTVSENELTIEKGGSDKVEVYANTEEKVTRIDFTMIFSTYDIPAYFTVNPAYTDTNPDGIDEATSGKITLGTVNINVKEFPADTAGFVSIHTVRATAEDGSIINLDPQTINIKIGKVEKKPSEPSKETTTDGLLDKIESKLVTIDLKDNVYSYSIKVDKKVEELDLKPIARDNSTKVEITSQKISELKDNKIVITLTNGDKKETYNILVKVDSKDEIVIDNGEFVADKSYRKKWVFMGVVFAIAIAATSFLTKKK